MTDTYSYILLIEPYGIEIRNTVAGRAAFGALLIEPYGIEITICSSTGVLSHSF